MIGAFICRYHFPNLPIVIRGHRRYHMVVGFTITCASYKGNLSAYYGKRDDFNFPHIDSYIPTATAY